jgi:diguanylate cyclase (GGDEF)-like protein/PAS domain S-box-containing protein
LRPQDNELFHTLVENIIDYAIFMLDADGRVISWNVGAERVKGYVKEEILGQHFSRFYSREDIERGRPQHGLAVASAEGRFEDEGWRLRKDRSPFWANVVITPVRDPTGNLLGFAKVTRDLTEHRLATQRLESSEARLHAFMNHSPSLMFVKDPQGRYLYVNDAFTRSFGLEQSEVISHSDAEIFAPELAVQFATNDAEALAARSGIEFEEVARYSDGQLHTSIVHKFPILDPEGHVIALGGVATDITERKRLDDALRLSNIQLRAAIRTEIELRQRQEHLQRIANRDPLTGVANRIFLQQRAEHAFAACRRSGHLIALLFIDLDQFKNINDTMGHIAGDEVLRQVAARLSGCMREVDTIARLGGDEFIVLLEDIDSAEQVTHVTTRMTTGLANPIALEGRDICVTSSIGVALYPRDGADLSTLIRVADLAMYRGKQLGGNTVTFYTPDLDSSEMV